MTPTSENRNLRWGFIGCGSVTEVKSGPAYQMTPGLEVAGVTRRDLDKARDYARRHNIARVYSSPAELIAAPEIDAVYIATPPDSHFEYGMAVAAAGKICCIEKPLTSRYDQALQLCEAFEKRQLPLFVAYYRRSLPRFEQVRQWLQQGRIGEVRHIHWQLLRQPNRFDLNGLPNWRTDSKVAPGGYFEDIGSHGLDLFCHWLGPITQVAALSSNQQGLYSANDSFSASWQHQSGISGSGLWNFGSPLSRDQAEIIGSRGCIRLALLQDAPLELETADEQLSLVITNPPHIQQYHVLNMREHLAGRLQHPSMGRSAAHTTAVMEAIANGRSLRLEQ